MPGKPPTAYRDYGPQTRAAVRETYRENHTRQTLELARAKKARFATLDRATWSVWQALDRLGELVDDSDPDTALSQREHAFQTAEAIRRDGHPAWLVLTGLVHDLGKALCLFGEPQWAVVGDTFPVGCAFSDRIVHAELFAANPDAGHPVHGTEHGIYEAGCGLDAVQMSWGHDEYLALVMRDHLPYEALFLIRYHSFYAAHTEGSYDWLLSRSDRRNMPWLRRFNPYDLYSKTPDPVDIPEVRPFYEDLVARYLPERLRW